MFSQDITKQARAYNTFSLRTVVFSIGILDPRPQAPTWEKPTVVASPSPSGQQQQSRSNLSRRRTASSSSSEPTQIIYKETLGRSFSSESDLDLPIWQRTWFILLLLVMAFSFFGLALFLVLTLDSDYASSSVYAATSEGVEVISLFMI